MSDLQRPLLPRPPGCGPNAPAAPRPPKRRMVVAACEACRRRRVKCDARRPTCSTCEQLALVCSYPTAEAESRPAMIRREHGELKRKVDQLNQSNVVLEELFSAIQNRPEAEVATIVKRIRQGADAEAILRRLTAGDLLLQLHGVPETRLRFDFPYRVKMPTYLQTPANPYLMSLAYEAAFMTPPAQRASASSDQTSLSQYVKPFSAAEIVDPRLESVQPSRWTQVSKDDVLMRKLLRAYLHQEFDWFSHFHKDHFLDDMATLSHECCSPLLVNAVLAVGCHCYTALQDRAEHWNPYTLTYKFFAEAKRLWDLEQSVEPSVTTLQATNLITALLNMYGVDKIGWTYLVRAVDMAHKLKLFEPSTCIQNERTRHTRDFTAWCLFYWQAMICFHFFKRPLLEKPPDLPLPDPERSPEWYGEIWLNYPLSPILCPMNYGQLFHSKVKLCAIINRMGLKLFDADGEKAARLSSYDYLAYAAELAQWYSQLPDTLSPKHIVFPAQLRLHLHYHHLTIILFEMVVAEKEQIPFQKWPDDPHAILAHAKMCFEMLLRLSYIRHGFDGLDMYSTPTLALLSFMSLGSLKALKADPNSSPDTIDEMRSTLILGIKGLYDGGRNYHLPGTIFKVVLGDMKSEDVTLVQRFVVVREEENDVQQRRTQHVQSLYPAMGIVRRMDDLKTQRLDYMIKESESASQTHAAF